MKKLVSTAFFVMSFLQMLAQSWERGRAIDDSHPSKLSNGLGLIIAIFLGGLIIYAFLSGAMEGKNGKMDQDGKQMTCLGVLLLFGGIFFLLSMCSH